MINGDEMREVENSIGKFRAADYAEGGRIDLKSVEIMFFNQLRFFLRTILVYTSIRT